MTDYTQIEIKRVKEAIEEAKRFIDKAKKFLIRTKASNSSYSCYPYPERASMKRASMDLTKSLAKVRKTVYEE